MNLLRSGLMFEFVNTGVPKLVQLSNTLNALRIESSARLDQADLLFERQSVLTKEESGLLQFRAIYRSSRCSV